MNTFIAHRSRSTERGFPAGLHNCVSVSDSTPSRVLVNHHILPYAYPKEKLSSRTDFGSNCLQQGTRMNSTVGPYLEFIRQDEGEICLPRFQQILERQYPDYQSKSNRTHSGFRNKGLFRNFPTKHRISSTTQLPSPSHRTNRFMLCPHTSTNLNSKM